MIVSDIKQDARETLGNCSDDLLYRRLTEAVDLLANSGSTLWDGTIGQMTICVDDLNGCITLPRDVLTPIQLNSDGNPTFPRDQWFQYHLNGTGTTDFQYSGAFDFKGSEYPTFREIAESVKLEFRSEVVTDDGQEIRISYYDENDRVTGETLTLNFTNPPLTQGKVKQVRWIHKPITSQSVQLWTTGSSPIMIGWYYPDEQDPQYSRIKVNASKSIELIYRRKNTVVRSDYDYIPLRNKLAVIQALRSIRYRYEENIAKAIDAESDAVKLLEQEQNARNISNSPVGPQIQNTSSYDAESLWDDTYYS